MSTAIRQIITCPSCTQKLRCPENKGNLVLTCPKCRHRWDGARTSGSTTLQAPTHPVTIRTADENRQRGHHQSAEQRSDAGGQGSSLAEKLLIAAGIGLVTGFATQAGRDVAHKMFKDDFS